MLTPVVLATFMHARKTNSQAPFDPLHVKQRTSSRRAQSVQTRALDCDPNPVQEGFHAIVSPQVKFLFSQYTSHYITTFFSYQNMVHVVAVADGQGDVGRTIVEVLSQNQENRVLVLSRKKLANGSAIYVDYTNVSHIRDVLEKYNVEVVISCLNLINPEASQAELASGPLRPLRANKAAAIPGFGEDKVAFTYSFDVARFVDALVNTDKKWPKHSVTIGEKITANELLPLLKLQELYVGERFSVVHDDVSKLKRLQVTELPSHVEAYKSFPKPMLQTLFAAIGLWIIEGHFDLLYQGSLNQMFPHIELTSVKDLIDQAWKA
ncbi:hypothetical protein FPCIR_878 [Fusarium pseudocircinatum]|uniref:NmrA-like domain-containing protein n=1 Tax=Fusarium pseudocircinatum TaxID=56676 RepID=A0A8H5PWJ3_9HYPO|nr:hypothetical protein FPCIR_878 [Fusarium pseudocircinatum]